MPGSAQASCSVARNRRTKMAMWKGKGMVEIASPRFAGVAMTIRLGSRFGWHRRFMQKARETWHGRGKGKDQIAAPRCRGIRNDNPMGKLFWHSQAVSAKNALNTTFLFGRFPNLRRQEPRKRHHMDREDAAARDGRPTCTSSPTPLLQELGRRECKAVSTRYAGQANGWLIKKTGQAPMRPPCMFNTLVS